METSLPPFLEFKSFTSFAVWRHGTHISKILQVLLLLTSVRPLENSRPLEYFQFSFDSRHLWRFRYSESFITDAELETLPSRTRDQVRRAAQNAQQIYGAPGWGGGGQHFTWIVALIFLAFSSHRSILGRNGILWITLSRRKRATTFSISLAS